MFSIIDNLSWFIGYFLILFSLFKLLRFIYVFFIRSSLDLKKFGQWVVITGSTDGIGKAFCHEFAEKGLNVCLISRSLDKLQLEAKEIEKKYKVKTRVIAFDFNSNNNEKFKAVVENQLLDLDIGILVNNVGVCYSHAMIYDQLPISELESMINVNIRSTTLLTKSIIPLMREKKKGVVVNIGSLSSVSVCPLLSVYSASKSFIQQFTNSLYSEYINSGIFVQCITPGLVCSNMSKINQPSPSTPSARVYVKSAIRSIGQDRFTTGYWSHQLECSLANIVTESFIAKMCIKINQTR